MQLLTSKSDGFVEFVNVKLTILVLTEPFFCQKCLFSDFKRRTKCETNFAKVTYAAFVDYYVDKFNLTYCADPAVKFGSNLAKLLILQFGIRIYSTQKCV